MVGCRDASDQRANMSLLFGKRRGVRSTIWILDTHTSEAAHIQGIHQVGAHHRIRTRTRTSFKEELLELMIRFEAMRLESEVEEERCRNLGDRGIE
jgi:hypothetical protein